MLTKDQIDTLVLIVVACALGATVWYYTSERSAASDPADAIRIRG